MSDPTPPPEDAPNTRPAAGPFGGVITRPPEPAPAEPEAPPRPSADPQAGVDTKEIALAELQAAARRAQTRPFDAPVEVEPDEAVVDLAGAEQQEATELEAAGSSEADGPGVSPIDPRIRERRVAVTRAEGRRRLRILLTAVSLASALGIAWLVVQSPLLAVDTINVRGTARESQAAVLAAARVHPGAALLFVDTGEIARRVEALPWVAKATVDRELPNDLTITIIERSPVAWVRRPVPRGAPKGTVGTPALVDRFGRVLGDEAQPPAGLPELVGLTRLPERGGRIRPAAPAAAIAALPDALRAQTGSVIERRGQAVLKLVALPGGARPIAGEVRLGTLDEIAAKGAAALAVIDQLALGREHVRYVDVRVPGAPATG